MPRVSNPMSCRVAWPRNSLIATALLCAASLPASASSLDEYNAALDNQGTTYEVREARAASYSAALAEDLIDNQLTIQQRTAALYGEALDDAFMKHFGQAIDEFTVLIDGSDPRIGVVPTDSFYYSAALEWRAHCLSESDDMKSAVRDIDQAMQIRPYNWTIKRMHDEIYDKLKNSGAQPTQ